MPQLVTMIVGTLLVVCLVLLKVCYNSFSLPYVLRTYGERKKIEDVSCARRVLRPRDVH
jgi:hypothetical protein